MTAPPAATKARYDGLICAALALLLQGEDTTPVLGPSDTAEAAAALYPVWSCLTAASSAVMAAAAVDPDDNLAAAARGVIVVDPRRVAAAVQALNQRAAALYAAAAEAN